VYRFHLYQLVVIVIDCKSWVCDVSWQNSIIYQSLVMSDYDSSMGD
jgi:hypothetical protein